MNAIKLEHVYFRYEDNSPTILRDINLELDYGKFVLITGSSGSGKSTIMNIINGTTPSFVSGQLVGDVFINGKSNKNKTIGEIALEVGSVLQNADLQIVHNLVDDEISFGLENLGINKEEINNLIDKYTTMLNLDKNYQTKKLSGGQKQRLISASTLAMGQKIIILDEPLANLDKEGSILVLNKLKELVIKDNYLVILIEHRLEYLEKYVDETYILENKKVIKKPFKEIKQIINKDIKFEKNNDIKDNIILSIKNVDVNYKKKEVLKNINLDIYEKERLLLIGENGVGKTTLGKVLSRLIKPTKGKIESSIKKKWFNNVGYVFQNPNYQLFNATVEKELSYACKDDKLKEYVIKYFNLEELLSRHPYSLSVGQKRKVAAISIILMLPKILILDEPTVGQDDESLIKLINIVNKLNKEYNSTVITITHDYRCAKSLSDRVIWLKDKSIYKTGDNLLVDKYFKEINNV